MALVVQSHSPLPPPMDTHCIRAALYHATQPSLGSIALAGLLLTLTHMLLLSTVFLQQVWALGTCALTSAGGHPLTTPPNAKSRHDALIRAACWVRVFFDYLHRVFSVIKLHVYRDGAATGRVRRSTLIAQVTYY